MNKSKLTNLALSKRAMVTLALAVLYVIGAFVEWPRASRPPDAGENGLLTRADESASPPSGPNTSTTARPLRTRAVIPRRDEAPAPRSGAAEAQVDEWVEDADAREPLEYMPPPVEVAPPSSTPNTDQDFADLQQQWERESDDPQWSAQERASALELFAELEVPRGLLRDVRCRRSLCRITVDAQNPLQLASLAGHLIDGDPTVSFRLQDGEALAYVPRDRDASSPAQAGEQAAGRIVAVDPAASGQTR